MKTPDLDQIVKDHHQDRRDFRRQLDEYVETQKWAHHVVDLNTRKVHTTTSSRPVAPLSRARRLSQAGLHVDTSIFDGPSYELSPRHPYLSQPEAWMLATMSIDYSTVLDFILWEMAQDATGPHFRQLLCHFDLTPNGRSLISISMLGKSWHGMTGSVLVSMTDISGEARVPVGQSFAERTIDIAFDPVPGRPVRVFMVPTPGIEFMMFKSMILRDAPPVFFPG